jgi:hypothetical protein
VGPQNTFQLVIRPAAGGGTNVDYNMIERLFLTPNPADNFIRIETPLISGTPLNIYNVSGQLMFTDRYEYNREINVSRLNPGVYYMRINDSDGMKIGKFIKK